MTTNTMAPSSITVGEVVQHKNGSAVVHTNAEQLHETLVVVAEADSLRATLMEAMQSKFREIAKSEDSLSKGLYAEGVQSIVAVLGLPESNRPKYAKIAEVILAAMGRSVQAVSQVRLSDETLQNRTSKGNAYRQYATPFVALARWEAGLWTKPETKHRERNPDQAVSITYENKVYSSPVDALKAGVPYSTAYRLFRNVISPGFTDLSKLDAAKSMVVAKGAVKGHSITIRDKDDDGNQKKARVKVFESGPLVVGTVIGLLEAWKKPVTQSQFDQMQAALVLVQPVAAPKPATA